MYNNFKKRDFTYRKYDSDDNKKYVSYEVIYKNTANGFVRYAASYDKNGEKEGPEVFSFRDGEDFYETFRHGTSFRDKSDMSKILHHRGYIEHSSKNGKSHGVEKEDNYVTGRLRETIWIEGKAYTPGEILFAMYQNNGKSIAEGLADPTPAITAKIQFIDNAPKKPEKTQQKRRRKTKAKALTK